MSLTFGVRKIFLAELLLIIFFIQKKTVFLYKFSTSSWYNVDYNN